MQIKVLKLNTRCLELRKGIPLSSGFKGKVSVISFLFSSSSSLSGSIGSSVKDAMHGE